MPEFNEHTRFAIDEADPTRWRDLTAESDDAEFDVEHVGERTLVYRVLVPAGEHAFGAELPLFTVNREQSEMDSSWTPSGELPRNEVGIVHKVGVGVAPMVLDRAAAPEDIAKVIGNGFLSVSVNQEPLLKGSLETMPIGLGLYGGPATNGLPAADAVPDRFPLIYTNDRMRFEGKLSFPHRRWLQDALGAPESSSESECEEAAARRVCMTLSGPVLVSFYMTGVFGKVRASTDG